MIVLLLNTLLFLAGIVVGVVGFHLVLEYFVREDGKFTYRWAGRWYQVKRYVKR